ncbi:putative sulfate exporter family transporter [Altererythrobacter arenosus]|uniref:Sulfate exporter family transporter n=1 Tax=Altererythrobacter arenosus TaxID=3032592 RepID=A0ABY8FNY1_9SPHN|nr:putative sulfate exporter family transporter [Altererythrobacter sp. CAU 1644]WFL75970.1 putative sulfate exporter family transporter [Altererythrobacter sp. CAU 1644]
MNQKGHEFFAGDLFGEIYQAEEQVPAAPGASILPGLLVCGTASLAAAFLAQQYGFPIILLGLLIGLALSFVSDAESTTPGLDFASRHLLRAGIVLLGLQVTAAQVSSLGWAVFASLLGVMAAAFAAALLAARIVGESRAAGILAGGATAICGASAALVLYGVIGRDRLDQARFSVTLVGISVASAIAMSLYPALAKLVGFSDTQAGFLIGASVHDAAQAIGGGYSYSDEAGANATVVKLARVAMLAPIAAGVALWLGSSEKGGKASWRKIALPGFILGFMALLVVNSVIAVPEPLRDGALTLSKAMLLVAVTATAMRSRLSALLETGWRTLFPVIAASLASFLAAYAAALWVAQ